MGISDDIRPKKYRRIVSSSSDVEVNIAKSEAKEEIEDDLFAKQHGEDFFADTPIERNGQSKAPKGKRTRGEPPAGKRQNNKLVYTLVIVIAIVILIGLAVWQNFSTIKSYFDGTYKNKNDKSLNEIINSTDDALKNYDSNGAANTPATDTKTTEQTPAAAPAIDKSAISISVLNGSGVKGSAQTVANTLTAAGFTIKGTANAKSFNYAKTYIYYKTDRLEQANLVAAALSARQTEVALSNTVVGAAYDVVVVVGKQ